MQPKYPLGLTRWGSQLRKMNGHTADLIACTCLSPGPWTPFQGPSPWYPWTSWGVSHACSQASSRFCLCLTLLTSTSPYCCSSQATAPSCSSSWLCSSGGAHHLHAPLPWTAPAPLGQFCFVTPDSQPLPLPWATWMFLPCHRRNAFPISALPVGLPRV